MAEITFDKLKEMNPSDYMLVDIRNAVSFEYGKITGAVNMPLSDFDETALPPEKLAVIYCKNGCESARFAEKLLEKGINACSLAGGYTGWIKERIASNEGGAAVLERAERSIQKKFHKELFSKFAFATNEYRLVSEGDKIAVCISGGKDSMLMAKLFQELKRHNKFHFELVFLVMDPGYSPENRQVIEHNAKILNIPVNVFESTIFDTVYNIEKSPCYLCARMRRGYLYSKAKEFGCNKIALGHHFDDVIETTLMSILYSGQTQTMMPKLKSTNFEGMELIRPMYLIREDDIKRWRDYNELYFIQCACKFTQMCNEQEVMSDKTSSKRLETKHIIAELKKTNPYVENNIFKSMQNVNLETVIAYKDKNGTHSFLDNF